MGDAVVDLIPEGGTALPQVSGGAPANVAVGVARSASRPSLAGSARILRAASWGDPGRRVDIRHLIQDPAHRTSTVLVDLDEAGSTLHLHGAPQHRSVPEPRRSAGLPGGQWLLTYSIALANSGAQQLSASHGDHPDAIGGGSASTPTWRPGCGATLPRCCPWCTRGHCPPDVVKLSVEELQLLSGLDDLAAGLATLSRPALVLVTRGRGRGGPSGLAELLEWVGPKVTPLDPRGQGTPSSPGCWRPWPNGPRCRRWPSCPPFWLRPTAAGRSLTTAKGR